MLFFDDCIRGIGSMQVFLGSVFQENNLVGCFFDFVQLLGAQYNSQGAERGFYWSMMWRVSLQTPKRFTLTKELKKSIL